MGRWDVVIAAGVLFVGCSGGGSASTSSGTSSTGPDGGATITSIEGSTPGTEPTRVKGLSEVAAAEILANFDGLDAASQYALFDNQSNPVLVAAAADALAKGVSGDQLWAATYVWVNEGGDPSPLLPLVTSADLTIRVMAATGLIARGRVEGFTPLIDLITDETSLDQEPPAPAWYQATKSLVRFTGLGELGPPLDADAGKRTEAQKRWRAWFDEHEATLTFDSEVLLWHIA